MNLYLKQHIFSWGDKFTVYDANGNDRYTVQGEIFSWGKKLHVMDLSGREIAFIREKVFSFLPKYYITVNGTEIAEVVKAFTFFHPAYTVNGLGWNVSGDFFAHEYAVTHNGQTIASVSKQWFTFGDAYEICILPGVNELTALAVVLVIDACVSDDNDNVNNIG